MNVKEAIARAKDYARDLFSDEKMSDLGVEEVSREGDQWLITLGLSRPWDKSQPSHFAISQMVAEEKPARRSYHVFEIDNTNGEVINVRLRGQ